MQSGKLGSSTVHLPQAATRFISWRHAAFFRQICCHLTVVRDNAAHYYTPKMALSDTLYCTVLLSLGGRSNSTALNFM